MFRKEEKGYIGQQRKATFNNMGHMNIVGVGRQQQQKMVD